MSENAEDRLRILIVDDEGDTAEALKLTIEETLGSTTVDIDINTDFDSALAILFRSHPYEAAILDLFRGNVADGDKAGQNLWQGILLKKFIPVIIYTAGECEMEPDFPEDNPILKCFEKTPENRVAIARHMLAMKPYILELREIEREFNEAIRNVLLDTSSLLWVAETDSNRRPRRLLRSARRRLAAIMDMDMLLTGEQMLFWEQYLVPPLGECLLTGDLLLDKTRDPKDPTAYMLVLTPSCDLEIREAKCNVDKVLVAKCVSIDDYLRKSNVSPKASKMKDKLYSLLNEAQSGGYIPLPEYKSVIPLMAACLRDLELIVVPQIDLGDSPEAGYKRIASIDSPFREQIAWAYLQVSARPGMPTRDIEQWAQEIVDAKASSS